uniref:Uncharacterized protein n=1 Tax=Mesocestoides corti TaxID=53468 RepID=A0A5K3FFR1_MESCO
MNDSDSDIVPAAITDDVQARLNTLNHASTLINQLEVNLDNARRDYQTLLTEATQTLASYCKKLKPSIEKARPYFDLLKTRKQLLQDLQLNSQDYRAAQSEHDDAASILDCFNANVARFGESDESDLDEVNKAVEKVNITKTKLKGLQQKHECLLSQCTSVDDNLRSYRSRFGTAIRRSQPYFDSKAFYNQRMEDAKRRIDKLTEGLKTNKRLYTQTMRSLEAISNRIHESRRLGQWLNSPPPHPPRSASRSLGVGAEGSTTTTAEFGEGCPSLSLPSSPRHTPSGQADTDTEEEGGSSVFDQRFATSEGVSKLDQQPLIDGLLMALRSCSRIPVSENFSASEFDPPNALNQTDPPLLQNGANYQQFPPIASASRHSRSRSL